jgi:hypothetical protein
MVLVSPQVDVTKHRQKRYTKSHPALAIRPGTLNGVGKIQKGKHLLSEK